MFHEVDFKVTNILGFLPASITSWNDLETYDVMYKADWTNGLDRAEFWDLCDALDRPFKHDIVRHLLIFVKIDIDTSCRCQPVWKLDVA